mgnify:CR=1 FL=1
MARRVPSQERGRRTQESVVEGAAAVFEFKGYEAASLGEIAEASHVSQGTMYFHFKSKEQIALAVLQEQHDRMYKDVDEAVKRTPDPLGQIIYISHTASRLLIEDVVVRAGINLAMGQGALRDASARSYVAWTEALAPRILRAQEAAIVHSRLPAERIARSLVSSFTGIQLMSQAITNRADLMPRMADMWQIMVDSVVVSALRNTYQQLAEGVFTEPLQPTTSIAVEKED